MEKIMSNTDVCVQCGDCCNLFFINLNEEEYKSGQFKMVFDDIDLPEKFSEAEACGANFLAKEEDGNCIYLKNNSCIIHKKRPQVCRAFFCNSENKEHGNMRKLIQLKRDQKENI